MSASPYLHCALRSATRIRAVAYRPVVRAYHHIAIVGTGPSAFYTAKYCLDINSDVRVDLFEKLPTPYGLVRFGVAPDHPEVKTVEETFTQVAESGRVRLFGNVEVGDKKTSNQTTTIPLQELQKSYSAVVMAYGASSDVSLGLPGENLQGVVSSRSFVNWYNGHPDFANLHKHAFDVSKVEHVVVVGQGNVALDCARILTKHVDDLRETDISTQAFNALCKSDVKTVTVLGRRGHVQSAFTIKELRELTRMRGVKVLIDETELAQGRSEASIQELEGNRPKKRIVELIENIALGGKSDEGNSTNEPVDRTIRIQYLTTPVAVVGDPTTQRVKGLRIIRNKLTGPAGKQKAEPLTFVDGGDGEELLPCDLLIRAVGYKCESISAALPFSATTSTIPHLKGRVVAGAGGAPLPGMYVTGWLKRGATGIIASNIPDAKETAAAIGEDLRAGNLRALDDALLSSSSSNTDASADAAIASQGAAVSGPRLPWMESLQAGAQVVDWPAYKTIEAEETRRGQLYAPPKLRDKITSVPELLKVARGEHTSSGNEEGMVDFGVEVVGQMAADVVINETVDFFLK